MSASGRAPVVCADCGRRLPPDGRGLCRACYKRRWREDPANAERDREASRKWKAANLDQARAYNRAYEATHKGTCSRCGGPQNRKRDGGICRACRHAAAEQRCQAIVQMWNAGRSIKGIAAELDSTPNSIGAEMVRMRRDGYDLPYRSRPRTEAA